MKPAPFNNQPPKWALVVVTIVSIYVGGCGHSKLDLLTAVNKRFPVQTEKIEVQSVAIKSKSIPDGKGPLATGETSVVLKEEVVTILAEVSAREWGFSNMMQVWDEPLPMANLPPQPKLFGNTEPYGSHPVMSFGAFLRGSSDASILVNEKLRIGLFRFVSEPDSPTNRRGLIKITIVAPKSPGAYVLDLFIVNGSATKEEAPRIGLIPFHRIPVEVR